MSQSQEYPLIIYELNFIADSLEDANTKINGLIRRIQSNFKDILRSYIIDSLDTFEIEITSWSKEKRYLIFEMIEEKKRGKESYVNEIYKKIIRNLPHPNFFESHWIYGEFFELFCTKSFSSLFYKFPVTTMHKGNIHMTKNTIHLFFILGELLLNTIYFSVLNFINRFLNNNRVLSGSDIAILLERIQYFTNFTELTRMLISNKELISDPGEKTFGISSQLIALDRTLDNIKLMVNLHSESTNISLQNEIKKYTEKTNIFTKVIIILTIITVIISVITCMDKLFEYFIDLLKWIGKFIIFFEPSISL